MTRLPRYTRGKTLASGSTAFFWEPPTWARPPAKRSGRVCPVGSTALGSNASEAIAKAEALNEAFDQWRRGEIALGPAKGSVRWLFAWYRQQERFTKNKAKTRRDYENIMDMLAAYPMRTGTLGDKSAAMVNAEVADKLYAKLKLRGVRYATYAMQVCRLVWTWAVRHRDTTGVTENPFLKMGLVTAAAAGNYAATRAEYDAYREKARELGCQSMATAAAIIFETCQRVSHVFGYPDEDGRTDRELTWDSWTPGVWFACRQAKTGNLVNLPLSHRLPNGERELLYPELEEELTRSREAAMRHLRLIVVEERSGMPYAERRMSSVHRRICEAAGLPKQLTMTSFRHGGITEIGDSGEADVRPISGQKTLAVTTIYNKANAEKARRIAVRRRAHIALVEGGAADLVGMTVGEMSE